MLLEHVRSCTIDTLLESQAKLCVKALACSNVILDNNSDSARGPHQQSGPGRAQAGRSNNHQMECVMLTSSRGFTAATTLAFASTILSTPAFAQDEAEGPISVSANVTLASEYRFRGVDLSGGDLAIQGGFDVSHESGFYVGTWASSLDEDTVGFGSTELDIYGGWGGDITEGVALDVGVIGYIYPNAPTGQTDYVEFYGSLGFGLGPAEATVGVAYAPVQDSLGGTDNTYVYGDLGVGIPGTPVTVTGHLGYTDGFLTFTNDSKAFDWSIGAEATVYGPVSLGVSYVGAEGDIAPGNFDFVDDAIVVTLNASF